MKWTDGGGVGVALAGQDYAWKNANRGRMSWKPEVGEALGDLAKLERCLRLLLGRVRLSFGIQTGQLFAVEASCLPAP